MTSEPHPVQPSIGCWVGRLALAAAACAVIGQTLHYRIACGYYDHGIEYLLRFYHVDGAGHYVVKHILTNSYYPPLFFAWLLAVWALFGTAVLPHVLAGDALILAGAYLVYRTLLRRGIGEGPAGIAVAGFLLLPGVTVFARTLLIEQPMMLLVPLAVYLLARTGRFERTVSAAGLGIAVGLGMLTKWAFAAYVAVPIAYGLVLMAADAWTERRAASIARRLVPAIVSLVALLAVAGPWYATVFDAVRMAATAANDPTFAELSITRNLSHNLALLRSLTGGPVLWFLAAAWIAGVIGRPSGRRMTWTLLAGLVPLVLFSLPSHLEDRYLYPLLVFCPFVVTMLDGSGGRRKAAWTVSAGFFTLAILANVGAYREGGPLFDLGPRAREVPTARLVWQPQHTDRIVEAIRGDAAARGAGSIVVAVHPLFQDHHSSGHAMLYESRRGRETVPMTVDSFSKFSYEEYAEGLAEGRFDYVVVSCDDPAVCDGDVDSLALRPEQIRLAPYIDQRYGTVSPPYTVETVRDDLRRLRQEYVKAADVDLGDSQSARIFRRADR